VKRRHEMPFGAQLRPDGSTRFRLWAPSASRVVLDAELPAGGRLQADLNEAGDGWYELVVSGAGAGSKYQYRIDDEIDVPDPASRYNPQGVQAHSEVIDPTTFEWRDDAWRGREWHEAVIYELHVGTFTQAGTYGAAIDRLDELVDLGVTAIELMSLAAFPGQRGWGYDGVLPYAPHAAYGRPDELKRLIQAAHERGLMMLLDVVYNHFGPEGNYLPRYARQLFTSKHHTPWGDAINFDAPVVREFFIQNALYWLEEYRFDGLRIDAVHAMYDDGQTHFIDELVDRVHAGPGQERKVHVVLENHHNEARRLGERPLPALPRRPGEGTRGAGTSLHQATDSSPPPLAREGREGAWNRENTSGSEEASGAENVSPRKGASAQWNDDFHHALHVIVSGESDGYYVDYADAPIERLGRVLSQGFAYQGERSKFSGQVRGEPSDHLSPTAFINFLQNHDQIGNRAFGERLAQLADPEPLRAGLAILLLSPQIPMLFMGEEYAASQPFLYFCDYQGELAAAISKGRREEFAGFGAFADADKRAQIPDPNDPRTFKHSRLIWAERNRAPHAAWLRYTRDLLHVRADKVVPLIPQILPGRSAHQAQGRILTVQWPMRSGATLHLDANLGGADASTPAAGAGELLFSTAGSQQLQRSLAAWEVRLRSAPP
jgi:maltooligosyltrehalose trehalohydrolase